MWKDVSLKFGQNSGVHQVGLQGKAALVGVADYKNVRKYTGKRKFYLEQWAELTQMALADACLLYTSPSPRDQRGSRMPSSA